MSMSAVVRRNWRFGLRIVAPLASVALTAVALAAFGIFWTTSKSDAVSVERQIRTTKHALSLSVDALAKEQQTIAAWDDPVLELAKARPDWQWFDDEIGVWLYDLFGHDHVYILDPRDRPVYAMQAGTRASPDSYVRVASELKPLVDAVRGRSKAANGPHDRNPGKPVAPRNTLLTSEKMVHDSNIVQLFGRPAAASVMRIVPLTDRVELAQGEEHLIVSVRFLDGAFLKDLSAKNLIAAPRFSHAPLAQPGEEMLPLSSEHGVIGYFFWRPELPGTRLLKVLGPLTALAVALMIACMAMLARWLRRAMVELQASEAQAQHLAFHDVLTGLPNRALFSDRLEQALARARRGERVTVLALDLDRFKQVNDTLGHHAGDTLIREFARRLVQLMRETDTVARLGGDEFAVILGSRNDTDIQVVCERILEAVRSPFELHGGHVFIGVSIGVIHAPEASCDRIELLRKADITLYRAKAEGRNCFRVFTEEMDETVRLRGGIEEDLRSALATGAGLQLFYQPQVAGADHRIVGLEALVRWQHPSRGLLLPSHFVPIAEECGLIRQLGDWVLKETCAASKRWPNLFIAVNLSPVQFRSACFADRLIALVRECDADPRQIELEVTESVLLDDNESVRRALSTLRAFGFRIALDDFGTGYSSISYLQRFEVDKIKIDKSFIQHLGQRDDSAAIITAVVSLGHAMGLSVVAEGVETEDQRRFLASAGCNGMQGYLFSRALPENEISTLFETQASASFVA